jgi:hypothetical protein
MTHAQPADGQQMDTPMSSDPMSTDTEHQQTPNQAEEFWLYAGRRLGRAGKPIDAWVAGEDATGQPLFYAVDKGPAPVVGALYRVTVTRDGEECILHGRPEFSRGQVADLDTRVEWAARDMATRARLSALRRERAAAKRNHARNDLDELIEPLRAVAAKLRVGADRDAFLAYVLRRLTSAW